MKLIHLFLIVCLASLLNACSSSPGPGYKDLTENELSIKSTGFTLLSEGKKIFIEKYKTYFYAHLELTSSLNLTLNSVETIEEYGISPERHEIEASQTGNSIDFTLEKAGYYMVRINQDQRIFILADSPESALAAEAVSILDYGVDNTGKQPSTAQLQKALDEISGSDKVLEFPKGVYKTGLLQIRSYSKIHLSPGAILMGPDDISDLKPEEYNSPRRFIMIKDAENVEITGRGIIDANGRHLRDHFGDEGRARALLVLNSKNVVVDGVFLRNSGSWNTQILHAEDVIFRNIKMLNDIELSNTDGFDPDASKRVLIENCFAYCGDDNVAIKSTNTGGYLQDVEDITVRGCVFLTKKSALKVGTESRAEAMKNILFENNDILESDRGMTLYCYDGASYDNIRYINNRFERTHPDRCQCGLHFRIRKRNDDSRIGTMSNILIRDCSFSGQLPNLLQLTGHDDDHKINLVIENLTIDGEVCSGENETLVFEQSFADIRYR